MEPARGWGTAPSPASPRSWRGGCGVAISALPEAPSLETGDNLGSALGATRQGRAGRLVPPRGRRIPALRLLLLHPFPASSPRGSLCCSLGLGCPCLWVGRRPCSYTLTYVWPRVCTARHALPRGCCRAGCSSQRGRPVQNYLHTGYHCMPGGCFPPLLPFSPPAKEFPSLPVRLRGAGRAMSVPVPLSPEGSERWQGLKVSRRTSQLFCVICEELGSCQSPSGEQ